VLASGVGTSFFFFIIIVTIIIERLHLSVSSSSLSLSLSSTFNSSTHPCKQERKHHQAKSLSPHQMLEAEV